MNKSTAPVLQVKWDSIIVYVYKVILPHLNKSERISLGQDIRKVLWSVNRFIIEYIETDVEKQRLLLNMFVYSKLLIRMISVAIRVGAIPRKRLSTVTTLVSQMIEIIDKLNTASR